MSFLSVQVDKQYHQVVAPFFKEHPVAGWPTDSEQQFRLYTWATAVVSAYSFTLGEDRFQGMVSGVPPN